MMTFTIFRVLRMLIAHMPVVSAHWPMECRPSSWQLPILIFEMEFFLNITLCEIFLRLRMWIETTENCIIRASEIARSNIRSLLFLGFLLFGLFLYYLLEDLVQFATIVQLTDPIN